MTVIDHDLTQTVEAMNPRVSPLESPSFTDSPPREPQSVSVGEPLVAPDPHPFHELRLFAECFEDSQKSRMAMAHRVQMSAIPADPVKDVLADLRESDRKLRSALRGCFKRVAPDIFAWSQETPGIGEHLLARLLGVIGDPSWAYPCHWEGEGSSRVLIEDAPYPRMVSQLWSYCGHGDPARKRRKGMSAEEATGLGSPRAKSVLYLISNSIVKCNGNSISAEAKKLAFAQALAAVKVSDETLDDDASTIDTKPITGSTHRRRSPYRDVYDVARIKYLEREWTSGHQHAAALRLTGKTVLLDLWLVANGQETKHPYIDDEVWPDE